jgi:hypothetical protein
MEVDVCAPNSHILRADVRIRCSGDGKFISAFVSKTFCNFCILFLDRFVWDGMSESMETNTPGTPHPNTALFNLI